MSKYLKLAEQLSKKNVSEFDSALNGLKTQREIISEQIKQEESKIKQQKLQQQAQGYMIKSEQKQTQFNKELMQMMIDEEQVGPMAVGGQMVDRFAGVETEPEAMGLPIIDGLQV